jgi:hypothetical protein
MLLQVLLGLLTGTLVFVLLWAGLNFVFGTALDTTLGAFFMEAPCQQLAGTDERLTGYTPGRGGARGGRTSASVCHFGDRPVAVIGRTDALGFQWREFLLLATGLVGYALCFVTALVSTIVLLLRARWLIGRLTRRPG